MPEDRQARRSLGYALNVFPAHTLAELWECLRGDVLEIKRRMFPDEPFPVEIRFSEAIVRELQNDCGEVARLKYFLDVQDLALVTVNAFVLPKFHGEPVKERVYLPAWHESEARLRFTNAAVELLGQLTTPECGDRKGEFPRARAAEASQELRPPSESTLLSVSVPFGALKPVTMDQVAPNIRRAGEHARQLRERTGNHVVIALEPEPGLTVETTDEVIGFFERFVPDDLRPWLGVNFDLAHQLVEFEDLTASLRELVVAGITVAKIHVTNAAELTELKPFYEDSIYLHQTTACNAQGEKVWFSLDWPARPPPLPGLTKYRVHYHLPVCPSAFPSTLPEVAQFLTQHSRTLPAEAAAAKAGPFLHHSVPFIIETYTWPQQLRGREGLVDNICREIEWVREHLR